MDMTSFMVCEIMDVVAKSCNGHLYEFKKLLPKVMVGFDDMEESVA
jgi:hypothetical protein